MARTRRIRRHGGSGGKVIPKIRFTPKSIALLRDIKTKWKKRSEMAHEFFLLDVGRFLLKEIQSKAPEVLVAGGDVDYARQLRLGIVETGASGSSDVLAIYLDGEHFQVSEEGIELTVLYFRPRLSSPEWVTVLARHGPWPALLVPVMVSSADSATISRRARPDEITFLSKALMADKTKIEAELMAAGAMSPEIGESKNAIGLSVKEDIGYNVLRREFGMDGEMAEPHWRPAIKATKEYAEKSLEKVIDYIVTGNKNVFDLPEESDRIETSMIVEGEGFAKSLAPLLK